VALNLNMTVAAGNSNPAGLQWTVSYPGDAVSLSIVAGPALTASGKPLTCVTFYGSTICLAAGMDSDQIGSGTVAVVTVTTASSTTGSSIPIGIVNTSGVLPNGTALTVSGAGGTITVDNPVPSINSLSPSSATAGTGAFTLTVNGTGFVNGAAVLWNGSSRTTTFGGATQLHASITAADMASPLIAQVAVVNPAPGGGISANALFAVNNPPSNPALQFVPVVPCRVMDTRVSSYTGPFGPPSLAANSIRSLPIPSGSCGIPASAQAYSLNITAVPISGLGFLTAWPTGQPQPVASTLNSLDGSIVANGVILPAGTGGAIDVYASDQTDLLVDINGYFIPPGNNTLQFYPLVPCRVLDTRSANGTFGGPAIGAGTSRSFPIPSGGCGVPGIASAYAFNVTAVPPGSLGYLTAWPTGQPQPGVSTLNSLDGTVVANAAIVPAGTAGAVSFYADNTTDLVVDINGYFAPPAAGGLNYFALAPCRVVDTRNPNSPLGGPIMSGGTTRTFPLTASTCGLPGSASAYSLNVTVVPAGYLGYLTMWPAGQGQPYVSSLNAPKGLTLANSVIVPSGTNGSTNVFVLNATHVVVDANGYFQ
jgi:hypothetical protein